MGPGGFCKEPKKTKEWDNLKVGRGQKTNSLIGTSSNGVFMLHMEVGKTEFCVIHVYEI